MAIALSTKHHSVIVGTQQLHSNVRVAALFVRHMNGRGMWPRMFVLVNIVIISVRTKKRVELHVIDNLTVEYSGQWFIGRLANRGDKKIIQGQK